jgi:hypothetical protein
VKIIMGSHLTNAAKLSNDWGPPLRDRSATASLPQRADFKGDSDCSTPSFGPPWSVAGRGNYDPTQTFNVPRVCSVLA